MYIFNIDNIDEKGFFMLLIKRFLSVMSVMLVLIFGLSQRISCSTTVQINNFTQAKVDVSLDIIGYPDPLKTINKNSTINVDIGNFFMRGITVGVHLGDYYLENVMFENLPQTLGLGDLTYYIFMKAENLGQTTNPVQASLVNEYTYGLTLYLFRAPKFLYPGGLVSQSALITVKTTNFNTFSFVSAPTVVPRMTQTIKPEPTCVFQRSVECGA